MAHKRLKTFLVASFIAASIASVAAQGPQQRQGRQQKRDSSFSPVVITEPFAATMARMKRAEAEVVRRQMQLLNERYDLSKRVDNNVKMTRGKPVPVGPATKLASGVTWERLAEM